jgi:hypothetical protein
MSISITSSLTLPYCIQNNGCLRLKDSERQCAELHLNSQTADRGRVVPDCYKQADCSAQASASSYQSTACSEEACMAIKLKCTEEL